MKAWKATLWDISGICLADTRSKAKYIVFKSAKEAGYEPKNFNDIHAKREPKYDNLIMPRGSDYVSCDYAKILKG